MNDIEFKLSEVKRFRVAMLNLGREIYRQQDALKHSLSRVSDYWKDESIEHAKEKIANIDRRMMMALDEIDRVLAAALRKQEEWAERYHRIR